VDHLAALESRKRAGMAKRLILEALTARGLWDMEQNRPCDAPRPAVVPGRRPKGARAPAAGAKARRADSLIGIVTVGRDDRLRGSLYLLKDGSVHVEPNFIEALRIPRDAFAPFRHEDWRILRPDGSRVPNGESPFALAARGIAAPPRVLGGQYKDGPVIWMIVEARPTDGGAVLRYVSVDRQGAPCASCNARDCFTGGCSHPEKVRALLD
jgi:hypothetical protein